MSRLSKTQLNDKTQTVWTAGDQVATFHQTEGAEIYLFDGKTGDRNGSFTYQGTYIDSNQTPIDLSDYNIEGYYALYPASAFASYGTVSGAFALVASLAHQFDYVEHSYGLQANTMLGTSTDGEHYTFKNLHGYLQLSLTGDRKVQSVSVQSNSGQYIAGNHYFTLSDVDVWNWYASVTDTQQINCGDEGVLLSDMPTDFYFVLPPMTLNGGITVTITFTDGSLYQKSTSKSIPIVRNTIQRMAVIDTSVDPYTQKIYIYHTGTTVAGPMLGGASSMAAQISWGDGNYSLLNELTSYDYTDGEESHVVTVKAVDAASVTLSNCAGVTKLDLSNF